MASYEQQARITCELCVICSETEVLHSTKCSKIIWGAGTHGAATKAGHLMVVPIRHAAQIVDLTAEETVDLIEAVYLAMKASYSAWFTASSWGKWGLGNKGSANIGFNFGPHGDDPLGMKGQDHLHVHVVPRNPNDTNFMWWSTRASILHLKDAAVREATLDAIAQLEADSSAQTMLVKGATSHSTSPGDPMPAVPDFLYDQPPEDTCPLCKEWDALQATEFGRVLFSIKPYKYGHVMVIPNRHVATLDLCSTEEVTGLMQLVADAAAVATEAVGTTSYSVGINHGPHSGASIPSHLHIHVIPRTLNDCSVAYWPETGIQHGIFEKPDKVRILFNKRKGDLSIFGTR